MDASFHRNFRCQFCLFLCAAAGQHLERFRCDAAQNIIFIQASKDSCQFVLPLSYSSADDPNAIQKLEAIVSDELALIDTMAALRCPIRTVCMGTAASMAALIFASGNSRDIMPHARVMIHDPLIPGGVGGSALKLDAIAKALIRTREITAQILADCTGHTLEEVYTKTAQDASPGKRCRQLVPHHGGVSGKLPQLVFRPPLARTTMLSARDCRLGRP